MLSKTNLCWIVQNTIRLLVGCAPLITCDNSIEFQKYYVFQEVKVISIRYCVRIIEVTQRSIRTFKLAIHKANHWL